MAMGPKRVQARMDSSSGVDITSPEFRTDEFRMYKLKVIECSKRFIHNWTMCPFAHHNEKARRRDPLTRSYIGVACPFIRQDQTCPYGEHCQYAHNVFEYWLHPSRYRTQLCNIAASCNRAVCFFAHTIEELRVPVVNEMESLTLQSHQRMVGQTRKLGLLTGEMPSPFATRAKGILTQLLTYRPVSSELHTSNSPMQDMNEIQLLIQLLQNQQILAGISDHNREMQLNFLDQLLRSLYREACSLVQPSERERLTKLIEWMYVQLVRNKTSLFSGKESLSLFAPMPETDPFHQLVDSMGRRQSLSRIPEMAEASLASVPFMRPSQELSLGLQISMPIDVTMMRSSSLDSRGTPIGNFSNMRLSDDSSGTRFSRTSGSPSMPRSSTESEFFIGRSGNVMSQDSSRMSWDDATPDFILHEWRTKKGPSQP